jgi:hypothetical protein
MAWIGRVGENPPRVSRSDAAPSLHLPAIVRSETGGEVKAFVERFSDSEAMLQTRTFFPNQTFVEFRTLPDAGIGATGKGRITRRERRGSQFTYRVDLRAARAEAETDSVRPARPVLPAVSTSAGVGSGFLLGFAASAAAASLIALQGDALRFAALAILCGATAALVYVNHFGGKERARLERAFAEAAHDRDRRIFLALSDAQLDRRRGLDAAPMSLVKRMWEICSQARDLLAKRYLVLPLANGNSPAANIPADRRAEMYQEGIDLERNARLVAGRLRRFIDGSEPVFQLIDEGLSDEDDIARLATELERLARSLPADAL